MSNSNLRSAVWQLYTDFPQQANNVCFCCRSQMINAFNFHLVHVVPKNQGGPDIIENLRPCCSLCSHITHTIDTDNYNNSSKQCYNLLDYRRVKYGITVCMYSTCNNEAICGWYCHQHVNLTHGTGSQQCNGQSHDHNGLPMFNHSDIARRTRKQEEIKQKNSSIWVLTNINKFIMSVETSRKAHQDVSAIKQTTNLDTNTINVNEFIFPLPHHRNVWTHSDYVNFQQLITRSYSKVHHDYDSILKELIRYYIIELGYNVMLSNIHMASESNSSIDVNFEPKSQYMMFSVTYCNDKPLFTMSTDRYRESAAYLRYLCIKHNCYRTKATKGQMIVALNQYSSTYCSVYEQDDNYIVFTYSPSPSDDKTVTSNNDDDDSDSDSDSDSDYYDGDVTDVSVDSNNSDNDDDSSNDSDATVDMEYNTLDVNVGVIDNHHVNHEQS